jgi:hypothetical protein
MYSIAMSEGMITHSNFSLFETHGLEELAVDLISSFLEMKIKMGK